jgi:hypothetical protein
VGESDGNVEYFTPQATDQLGFGMGRPLKMHATNHTPVPG